jgi:endoglucanase
MRLYLCLRRLSVLLVLSLPALSAVSAHAQTAFVRVNQLGYSMHGPKRAYLMAKDAAINSAFRVENRAGKTVFTAPLTAASDQGAWGDFAHVYALDFDAVARPGRHTIVVDGAAPATSLAFAIDRPHRLYEDAIENALSFYQNERDGRHFIRSSLRTAPAHLNDSHAKVYFTPTMNGDGNFKGDLVPTGATIDASGAWWDAGDYLKFVETHSYTVALMLTGARDFPDELGRDGERARDFTEEAKFGLDWLQRMWDDNSRTLYYQVGIGGGNDTTVNDHDLWRLPQVDDTLGGSDPSFRFIRNRPVFINPAGGAGARISPNIAGRLAADFALCFQLFADRDPAYARRCLVAAEHVFDLADTAPTGALLTAAPFGFYPETEWRDDLEWGATELYFALAHADRADCLRGLPHTDPRFYLRQAAHWAKAYMTGPNDAADTLNLFDVSGLAHFELLRALAEAGQRHGLEISRAELLADLKKALENAVAQAKTDPFGFGFTWNNFDTTSHGAGLVVMASEYDFVTETRTFERFGQRQLGNILGANAWGTSLIVGDGVVFPHCMQHQVANLTGSLDGTPPILKGAAVEGPNSFAASGNLDGMRGCPADGVDRFAPFNGKGAVFADNVESFSTVEPATDLSASSPLAFAWLIARAPDDDE